jgi:hypothetical protein
MPMLREDNGCKDNNCCDYYEHFFLLCSIVITAARANPSIRADIHSANIWGCILVAGF